MKIFLCDDAILIIISFVDDNTLKRCSKISKYYEELIVYSEKESNFHCQEKRKNYDRVIWKERLFNKISEKLQKSHNPLENFSRNEIFNKSLRGFDELRDNLLDFSFLGNQTYRFEYRPSFFSHSLYFYFENYGNFNEKLNFKEIENKLKKPMFDKMGRRMKGISKFEKNFFTENEQEVLKRKHYISYYDKTKALTAKRFIGTFDKKQKIVLFFSRIIFFFFAFCVPIFYFQFLFFGWISYFGKISSFSLHFWIIFCILALICFFIFCIFMPICDCIFFSLKKRNVVNKFFTKEQKIRFTNFPGKIYLFFVEIFIMSHCGSLFFGIGMYFFGVIPYLCASLSVFFVVNIVLITFLLLFVVLGFRVQRRKFLKEFLNCFILILYFFYSFVQSLLVGIFYDTRLIEKTISCRFFAWILLFPTFAFFVCDLLYVFLDIFFFFSLKNLKILYLFFISCKKYNFYSNEKSYENYLSDHKASHLFPKHYSELGHSSLCFLINIFFFFFFHFFPFFAHSLLFGNFLLFSIWIQCGYLFLVSSSSLSVFFLISLFYFQLNYIIEVY